MPVYILKNTRFRYTKSIICKKCHFLTKTQYVVFPKNVSHFILRFCIDILRMLAIIKRHFSLGGSIYVEHQKKRRKHSSVQSKQN